MSFRRFSFISEIDNVDLDFSISSLYPTSNILEKRCEDSLKGEYFSINKTIVENQTKHHILEDKTPEEVVEGLPKDYFIMNFDPVLFHLNEISSWSDPNIIEQFMEKIEDTDSKKDIIIGHLTSMIDENYDDLMECMQKVRDVNSELHVAEIHVSNARNKMMLGKEIIKNGSMKIQILHKKRNVLLSLNETIKDLKRLKDLHKHMILNINSGDVGEAANYAKNVLEFLTEKSYNFSCLKSIAENMGNNLLLIRKKADKSLNTMCSRMFTVMDYENIISSYLILDSLGQFESIEIEKFDITLNSSFKLDKLSCLEGLAQRINRFHLEDIDKSLHSAVMEYIYVSQQRKQKFALENSLPSAYSQINFDDIIDMTDIPLNILYKRISSDLLPLCIIRSCEFLVDIVHTNFLISQWHLSPFDSRNRDSTFLHSHFCVERYNLFESHEDLEGTIQFSDLTIAGRIELFLSRNGDILKDSTLFTNILSKFELNLLSQTYLQIISTRVILWEELLRGLVGMINSINFSSSIKLDDFVVMLWSLNLMIIIGKEFCGSDSKLLEVCIEQKSTEFFRNFHIESFQIFRSMLDAETWQCVPILINQRNDIFGTNQNNSNHSLTPIDLKVSESKDDSYCEILLELNKVENCDFDLKDMIKKSLLSSFSIIGNPFRFLTIRETQEEDPRQNYQEKILNKISYLPSNTERTTPQSSKKRDQIESFIVTQSVYNGLGKYILKYVNFMASIPAASSEIYEKLCHLFNLYISTVYFSFVSPDDRIKLFTKTTKMNSPPPHICQEFEALQLFLDEILNSNVLIPSLSTGSENDNKANLNYELVKLESIIKENVDINVEKSSNFSHLSETIVAAESCWFASQMMIEMKAKLLYFLSEKDKLFCEDYISKYALISGELRTFIYKSISPDLIKFNQILPQIIECSWDSKKLIEQHHDWVETLVANARDVWEYLSEINSFGHAQSIVKEQLWLEICQSCFDVALEGYSKVRKCSPEGRAAMTMDIFSLHEELNSIHLCRPPRGKHYVDSYLRVFYMGEEETLRWIHDNWQLYSYRHIHGLLTQMFSGLMNNKKLRDSISTIDSLYEKTEVKESPVKLVNMFSQHFKDENKFTNLLGGKFRK